MAGADAIDLAAQCSPAAVPVLRLAQEGPRPGREFDRRHTGGLAKATLGVLLALALWTCVDASSASALAFTPCPEGDGFSCASLPVALSRTGLAPGTIELHVQRLTTGASPARSAVLALAGGPGQAALPLAKDLAQMIAPALSGRDLIVFDQRGTGESDPLNCATLDGFDGLTVASLQDALEGCAAQIGPARGAFTTAESVADIETIREALGYEKLVLYGTSYGTKVALEYAERYPQYVESMLLDSIVPTNGPEPFELATFQALRPVLDELCSGGACKGIAAAPVKELAELASRIAHKPLRGALYSGAGRRLVISLSATELFDVLVAGDLNPALRALFPGALTAALHGQSAPLLQLDALAQGLLPSVPSTPGHATEPEVNEALYWDTTCEEDPFPWKRSATRTTREHEAQAALSSLPEADFYPFTRAVDLDAGPLIGCAAWPNLAPAASVAGTLPNVPTLILSGGQDLRTPTAQARRVAALIPDAQLLVVPYTGHSVLGSDLTNCARSAVQAFFAGVPVSPCAASKNTFAPVPIAPAKLADVTPVRGLKGKRGRTVNAVLETLLDLDRLIVTGTLQAERELPSGTSFGGLYGGYAKLTSTSASLVHFSFVPGVELSASLAVVAGKLEEDPIKVEGRASAHGTVEVGADGRVSGRLAGKRFDVRIDKARLASASADFEHASAWSSTWPLLWPVLAAAHAHLSALVGEP